MRILAAVPLFLSLAASAVLAQARTLPLRGGACSACRLVLEPDIVLGETEDVQLGHSYLVVRDSRGFYYATDYPEQSVIRVYDAQGRLVRRFGRDGEGPGEFRRIVAMAMGPGDSLHVVDGRNRHTVLAQGAVAAVRFQTLPLQVQAMIVHPDDRLVINADVPTPERVGLPIHVTRGGSYVRSLGSDDRYYRRDFTLMMNRALAPAPGGRVWAAPMSTYAVELWDTTGARHARIEAPDGWFTAWTTYRGITPDAPPQSVLEDVRQAGRYLLVLSHVAARDWEDNVVRRTRGGEEYFAERVRGAVYDTRFDVFDVDTRAYLGSATADEYFLMFVGTDRVGEPAETEDGHPYMRIWRLHVRQ